MVCSWFVARTKHSSEERAARELQKQDFVTFLPMARIERRQRDGLLVDLKRPLFTGYLFVSFDAEDHRWKSICSTFGITGLVGYDAGRDRAPSVPESEMAALRARLAEHGGFIPINSSRPRFIEQGVLLRVIFGPYRDRYATAQVDRGLRVDVLLRFAGAERLHRGLPKDCVEVVDRTEVSSSGSGAVASRLGKAPRYRPRGFMPKARAA